MNSMLYDVLSNDLKNIRRYFYKIDRLLAVYLPNLSLYFKELKIEAAHYSSPWFITLFTCCYSKAIFPTILYDIWDILLVYKWKGFFNIVVNVFAFY